MCGQLSLNLFFDIRIGSIALPALDIGSSTLPGEKMHHLSYFCVFPGLLLLLLTAVVGTYFASLIG